MAYNHQEIEQKWQIFWKKNKTFKAQNNSDKEKYYALDMFPFPSGAGLHVGHPMGYIATDIISRKKRMEGRNVLHPMGWDAFGLPTENYAIKTGIHPRKATDENKENFRRQLQALGFSYDWDREIDSTETSYYKWTQYIFLKLYKKGLLYEDNKPMNWCPKCKVVCANEEVEQGKHERCGDIVEKKALKQWMFKITDYAERLLKDLDELDEWPEKIKAMQKNWIGKSEGANVDFEVVGKKEILTVYTTRIDTLFSGTFLVMAPEHKLIKDFTTLENQEKVQAYIKECGAKSDMERTELSKGKTGAFTGSYAINPATGDKMPIWIADFVLASYGTGVVFADAHDERDFEMAKNFDIPLKVSVRPKDEDEWKKVENFEICFPDKGVLVNSEQFDGMGSDEAMPKIIDWLEEKGKAKRKINYKLRDWIFTRQRYWGEPIPFVFDERGKCFALADSELPVILPDTPNYEPSASGESPLSKIEDWVNVKGDIQEDGTVIISENGKINFKRETSTMPNWAGSSWYWLRFMDSNNDQEFCSKESSDYWGPVDLYVGGAEHAVLHLLYARFWHKALYDLGLVSTKEPFKKLVNQGMIISYAYETLEGKLIPIDEVEEKNNKFFIIETGEEVKKISAKMSKSLKNVVNPDDIVEKFGADTLRMYEMFMGPFDQSKTWEEGALAGMRKFLDKIHRTFMEKNIQEACPNKKLISLTHKTVKLVTDDIDNFKFNTAISHMMVWMNEFSKLDEIPKIPGGKFIRLLAPFAPHLAEEIWTKKFKPDSKTITFEHWPTYKEAFLVEDSVKYAVQVNGKLRADFEMSKDASKDEVLAFAKNIEKIQKYLEAGDIKKEIFVPGKIVGFVVK